jgi:hypothetical protein
MTLPADPTLLLALALFGLLFAISLLAYLLRKKLQARGLLALQLLSLLISLVGFLALAMPNGTITGWVGAVGLIGTFWLMSRFENTDRG